MKALIDNIVYDEKRDVFSLEFVGLERFNNFLNVINYLTEQKKDENTSD